MATYYIGADVHSNNTELAIEQRGQIVARYSVPTTIPAISTVLSSIQGKKILAMEEGPRVPLLGERYLASSLIRTHPPPSRLRLISL